MIKEATASVFVFHRAEGAGWRLALVWHPRLAEWLPAGGHVEAEESAAEAAVRETAEETGLSVRLLPGPAVPLPAGFPHTQIPAPWWIVEMGASADSHTPRRHVHVDHVFVAVAEADTGEREAVHEVRWFTEQQMADAADVAEDSRLQAKELFARIAEIAASAM